MAAAADSDALAKVPTMLWFDYAKAPNSEICERYQLAFKRNKRGIARAFDAVVCRKTAKIRMMSPGP